MQFPGTEETDWEGHRVRKAFKNFKKETRHILEHKHYVYPKEKKIKGKNLLASVEPLLKPLDAAAVLLDAMMFWNEPPVLLF